MKKVCADCGQAIEIMRFGRNRERADGVATYCKDCQAAKRKPQKQKVIAFLRQVRDEIKLFGCCLCGEKEAFLLDFHHMIPGEKQAQVNYFITSGMKKGFAKEVKKTIPLCSNCHRRVEFKAATVPAEKINHFLEYTQKVLISNGLDYRYHQSSFF